MFRIMRAMSSFLLIDRMVRKAKALADGEPSLDEALEQYAKAQDKITMLEQVIAMKHKKLQDIVNRVK